MVRRGNTRAASPRASSPVRSTPRASSPPPSSQRSFAAPPPRPAAGGPTAGGNPPMGPGMHPPPSQGRGPGLMGQMAATAGGVAIGSAVGHAVGGMFSGSSGHSEAAPMQQDGSPVQQSAYGQQQQPMQLCEVEWRQL
uniref:Uncharacterized protein n=1 Tax=Panagrolaimus sp. ES5 TaxID=591445 RepID=A0AC34FTS4_9BILA